MEIPTRFKSVTQYIRRAEKLDRASEPEAAVVAYHCRLFATEQAMKLQDNSDDSKAFLSTLIVRLEEDKKRGLTNFSQEEGKKMCTDWAMKEFNTADEEDRAGLADQNTARAFYAAGVFLDVLRQFGPTDEEMDKRRIYCKWKASQILKALKEGRTPAPGGVGDEAPPPFPKPEEPSPVQAEEVKQDDPLAGIIPEAPSYMPSPSEPSAITPPDTYENPVHAPPESHDAMRPSHVSTADGGGGGPLYPTDASTPPPSSTYAPTAPPTSTPYVPVTPAPLGHVPAPEPYVVPASAPYVAPAPGPYVAPAPGPGVSKPRSGGKAGEGKIADAIEYCRFAIRALEHKETELAVQKLQEALQQIL